MSKVLTSAFLLLLILSIGLWFWRSNFLVIRDLEIAADKVECAKKSQIQSTVDIIGKNFFQLDKKSIAKKIKEKFICVKDVTLILSFPNKAKLLLLPRQIVIAFIVPDDKNYLLTKLANFEATDSATLDNAASRSASPTQNFAIDNEGVIFSQNIADDVPKIDVLQSNIVLGAKLDPHLIDNLLKISEQLKKMGVDVKEILLSNDLLVINATKPEQTAPKIIFRIADSVDLQLASLQLILSKAKIDESSLEFIDLRFDKPVVRFTPKEKNGQR